MRSITLRSVAFLSFVKVASAITLVFGIIVGLGFFVFSFFDANVEAQFLGSHYRGVTAGVISVFLAPLLSALLGIPVAVIVFLPFRLLLMMTNGIRLRVDVEDTRE